MEAENKLYSAITSLYFFLYISRLERKMRI